MPFNQDSSMTSDSTSNSTLNQHNLGGSTTSLNSGNSETLDNTPMQLEQIKQQKEIRETGIEMLVVV